MWIVLLHEGVNFLNFWRESSLLFWLKLTYEIKPNNGDYRKIVNFTRNREDERSFERAAQINYKITEILRYFTYGGSLFICLPYFTLEAQLDFVIFWIFAIANWIFLAIFFISFLKLVCSLVLFSIVMLQHFSRRCRYILNQIEALKNGRTDIDNEKLSELLFDFNSLMSQIANVNGYWKWLFGKL